MRRVGEERGVVAVEDVYGQVRVGARQLVVEFLVERRVDGLPEGATAGRCSAEAGFGRGPSRRGAELRGNGGGEGGVEGVEAVYRARDAVEGDAFEADLPDEFGGGGR